MRRTLSGSMVAIALSLSLWAVSADQRVEAAELFGLTPGTVELQSAGPLSFGPSGVLFVGDAKAAKVYAINTEDEKSSGSGSFEIENLNRSALPRHSEATTSPSRSGGQPGNGQRLLVGYRGRQGRDCPGLTRWCDQPFESGQNRSCVGGTAQRAGGQGGDNAGVEAAILEKARSRTSLTPPAASW